MSDEGTPDRCVKYRVKAGVAHVTLNRPEALNALDLPTIARLTDIVREVEASEAVRAVLLTGTGRAFSAGGDVKAMLSMAESAGTDRERTHAAMEDGIGRLHPLLAALYRLPKPVIAAVNGAAAGAGVGLALAADVTWAASTATFKLAFTAIGVSPDSGTTFHLPRAVGSKLAAELFLTNRQLSAQEAKDAGLVSRVAPDDELLGQASDLAEQLAEGPTMAFARVKELLRSSLAQDLDAQLASESRAVGASTLSHDFGEGLKAFVEKRRPRFQGK